MPTATFALLFIGLVIQAVQAVPLVQVETSNPGVYRLSYTQLVNAGWPARAVPRDLVQMRRLGEPVTLHFSGAGELFGAGGDIYFAAQGIGRSESELYDYSNSEAFQLSLLEAPMSVVAEDNGRVAATASSPLNNHAVTWQRQWEENRLLLTGNQADPGNWVWYKLHQLQSTPFSHPFEMPETLAGSETARLQVEMRGWSRPAKGDHGPDHSLKILVNGKSAGKLQWQGRERAIFTADLAAGQLVPGANRIELRVEQRTTDRGDPLIDVVYLDRIVLEIGMADLPKGSNGRFHLTKTPDAKPEGALFFVDRQSPSECGWYATEGTASSPSRIRPVAPLPAIDPATEYLILTHSDFATAASLLRDEHTRRGRPTQALDVDSLYLHYAYGFVTPWAIRRFLSDWRKSSSSAKYVLLLGDADAYAKLRHSGSGDKDKSAIHNRIPSWQRQTLRGPAASDNWFVADLEDRERPLLAIGRLAVATPADATTQVNKTIAYLQKAEMDLPGKQRSHYLLISDQQERSRKFVNQLAQDSAASGFSADLHHAAPVEQGKSADQTELYQKLSDDYSLILFYGHGGRTMWRTSPENFRSQKDLFQGRDVSALARPGVLPVVVSLSCTTAPFDHPTASSLGEFFLASEGAGAVAFIGSSTNNRPTRKFAHELTERLLSGETIGEALMHSKRASNSLKLIFSYNLLGEPALALGRAAVPSRPIRRDG